MPTLKTVVPVRLGGRRHLVDISERKRAKEELRRAGEELERTVEERTAELAKINRELLAEIAEREQTEGELRASEEKC